MYLLIPFVKSVKAHSPRSATAAVSPGEEAAGAVKVQLAPVSLRRVTARGPLALPAQLPLVRILKPRGSTDKSVATFGR